MPPMNRLSATVAAFVTDTDFVIGNLPVPAANRYPAYDDALLRAWRGRLAVALPEGSGLNAPFRGDMQKTPLSTRFDSQ